MNKNSQQIARVLRFGSGAALSFCSTLMITYMATEWLKLAEELSFAISLVTVFFINFFYLRVFVFRSMSSPWESQMRDFFLASIGFRGAEYIAFVILLNSLQLHYLISVVSVLAASFLIKYVFFHRTIFKPD